MIDAPRQSVTNEEEVEYHRRFRESRRAQEKIDLTYPEGIAWVPQPGSQTDFLQCSVFETLYHGPRGSGKTDGLLMKFGGNVGRGFGEAWRGVIFRQTYPQLADVVAKSLKWFRRIFPNARFNQSKMCWTFEDGEMLFFRHMGRKEDYWNYHGHEYPFIGFEELCNWATDDCYTSMFACCRSADPDVPRMVCATTNPYGVGHDWVKSRFKLAGQWSKTVIQMEPKSRTGLTEPPRCAIYAPTEENRILLGAVPDYLDSVAAAANNEAMQRAWLEGSWDIVAGGMFSDVWSEANIVPDFVVPESWRIDRAFDWGSSKPFSVGWYAVSDGSDLTFKNGRRVSTVRGDLFRIREWYGSTGVPNEGLKMLAVDIAKGIVERELTWNWRDQHRVRVHPGQADSSIYTVENGVSIANDMAAPVRIGNNIYPGVTWVPADKKPGSRVMGWEMVRKMMKAAKPEEEGLPREKKGLFVVGIYNPEFLRTMMALPRDEKNMDDVDTDAEDHIADEVRYRVRGVGTMMRGGKTRGMW